MLNRRLLAKQIQSTPKGPYLTITHRDLDISTYYYYVRFNDNTTILFDSSTSLSGYIGSDDHIYPCYKESGTNYNTYVNIPMTDLLQLSGAVSSSNYIFKCEYGEMGPILDYNENINYISVGSIFGGYYYCLPKDYNLNGTIILYT